MKNILKICILLVSVFIGINFSCKREPAPTREEFLAGETSKTWVQKTIICEGQDVTGQIKNCILDNLYTFSRNQKFVLSEGATVCNPGDPTTKFDGYWSFEHKDALYKSKDYIYFYNTQEDILNGNDVLYPFHIEEILKNRLKVSYLDKAEQKTYKIIFEPQ